MTPPLLADFATDGAATRRLWRQLARPESAGPAALALLGLPPASLEHLRSLSVAASREATTLLDSMPSLRRQLKVGLRTVDERCFGEIRGPVQWSQSVAAQGASFGGSDVYVCARSRRHYDTEENRVVVATLREIRDAGRDVQRHVGDELHPDLYGRVVTNTQRAVDQLEHKTLADVRLRGPVTPREVRRARSGRRPSTYQPVLSAFDRSRRQPDAEVVVTLADDQTRKEHELFAEVLRELNRRGLGVTHIEVEGVALAAGPVTFVHRHHHRGGARPAGVSMGSLLLGVAPEHLRDDPQQASEHLAAQARGRPCLAVCGPQHVPDAIDSAIRQARGTR